MVLASIVVFFAGALLGLLLTLLMIRKNKLAWMIIQAGRKGYGIAFLEDETKIEVKKVVESHQSLSITDDGQIIVVSEGSIKPISGTLIPVVHGDFYKSITTPMALRKFIWERMLDGWKADDVAEFLQELEKKDDEKALREEYKDLKTTYELKEELERDIQGIVDRLDDDELSDSERANLKLQLENKNSELESIGEVTAADGQKYDVYVALPSSIAAFVKTGLNRVSINMQDELKQKTNGLLADKQVRRWAAILFGLGVFVMLVMLGLKFGGPAIAEIIQAGNSGAAASSGGGGGTILPQGRIAP